MELFPIQRSWCRQPDGSMGYSPHHVKVIPYSIIAPHEAQALANHGGQSLEHLANRGGLSPCEAVAVLEDRPWRAMDADEATSRLKEIVDQVLVKTTEKTGHS